jgi:hypothetical protein
MEEICIMHKFRYASARSRQKIRRKHRSAVPRQSARRHAPHDPSACIQPLDAAFDGDGRDFLEGWLRAEHVNQPSGPRD